MTTIADVVAEVEHVFDDLDAPSWPDPHPNGQQPSEEEYSRVTDPDRYRTLVLRLSAWEKALGELCDVDVDTMQKGPGRLRQRWSSPHGGTLPLYVSVVTIDALPVVGVSTQSDGDPFDIVPDCGCDACDSGSSDLIAVLDADIRAVLEGSLVVVIGPTDPVSGEPSFRLVALGDGWSVSGTGGDVAEPEAIVDAVRSGDDPLLPAGCTVIHGRPWLR